MRSPTQKDGGCLGLSSLEMLFAITLFSVTIAAIIELFLSVTARITLHNRREQVLRGAERFVSEFTSGLNQAQQGAIYPNRQVYQNLATRSLKGDAGDFCVLSYTDNAGNLLKTVELEAVSGSLKLTERDPLGASLGSLVCAQSVDLESGFLFKYVDSVLTLEFVANIGPAVSFRPNEHPETVRFISGGRAAALR